MDAEREARYARWAAVTEEQLQSALDALQAENGSSDDVFVGIQLAELSYRIALSERPEDEWPEEYEPECICTPEQLARNGFKGRCPVHGLGRFPTRG